MHFSVIVVGENIDDQLAPFDENTEVERYIRYTKEELIKKEKDELYYQLNHGPYSQWVANPSEYEEKYKDRPEHLKFIKEEIPAMKGWTDEQFYEKATKWYEDEDIDPTTGGVWSTYNPDSKWDWYEVGGRWAGKIKLKPGAPYQEPNFSWGWPPEEREKVLNERLVDSALIKDIENLSDLTCYGLLKDGEWLSANDNVNYSRDSYEVIREKEAKFDDVIKVILGGLSPETRITYVDIHI